MDDAAECPGGDAESGCIPVAGEGDLPDIFRTNPFITEVTVDVRDIFERIEGL